MVILFWSSESCGAVVSEYRSPHSALPHSRSSLASFMSPRCVLKLPVEELLCVTMTTSTLREDGPRRVFSRDSIEVFICEGVAAGFLDADQPHHPHFSWFSYTLSLKCSLASTPPPPKKKIWQNSWYSKYWLHCGSKLYVIIESLEVTASWGE